MDNKYDVFISYSRHDTVVVNAFVKRLEREGFSVWIDRDGIESGDAFKKIILQAIKNSAVVLFFSSQFSNQSGWTAKEIGVAVKYKKPIIPILLDGSNFNEEVEFDLINLDFIDYQDVTVRGVMMDRLVKSLKAKITNPIGQKKAEEARLKVEAAEREWLEQERRKKEEAERKAREEAERKAREAAERERKVLQATSVSPAPQGDTPNPPKKKTLWIALGIGIAAVVALIVILAKPKLTQSYDEVAAEEVVEASGSANGHEYVDLGLPSGTLWATCNVGASKPEGYGNYYAWGETSTKSTYNWDTYRYANGDYHKLIKYCNKSDYGNNGFTDNLTSLQSVDDPATANWGSGWQTPSKAQWEELLNNTTNTYTTRNGVLGRLFTSKKNRQPLFLPCVGYRWDSEIGNPYYDAGAYWSRSLNIEGPHVVETFFVNSGNCGINGNNRSIGLSVRPVRQK